MNTTEDIEAQDDEMIALGSIMEPEVFVVHPGPTKSGQIHISLNLPSEFFLKFDEPGTKESGETPASDAAGSAGCTPSQNLKTISVNFLPPLTLYFTLPSDYPSQSKPSFTLSSCWLDRSALSTLCKSLDENWNTNSGMAILYSWFTLLKEEALEVLGIKDTYDLSWWYSSGPNANITTKSVQQRKTVSQFAGGRRKNSTVGCDEFDLERSSRPKDQTPARRLSGKRQEPLPLVCSPNLPENDGCSASTSSQSNAKCSKLVPENQNISKKSEDCSTQRPRRLKKQHGVEAVRCWLDQAEGGSNGNGVSEIPSTSKSLSNIVATPETHPTKHGRNLDIRAVFDWQGFKSISDFLAQFNVDKTEQEFRTTSQTCDICYLEKLGTDCIRFTCSHIFCRECVKSFFSGHITNGSVDSVTCPGYDCKVAPTPDQVRSIVGEELYERYDRLLLTRSLDNMADVTFCPRPKCRYPAARDTTEKIATCSACGYVFCPVCLMVYHGVEPCRFKADDKKEVYNTYTTGTNEDKKRLEKIYGKKQLALLVDTVMSENWVSNRSKPCPHCSAPIEKFEGCNKVTCFNCHTYFCWICCAQLNRDNPYFHFNDVNSKCFNSLFEGADSDDEDDDEDDGEDYLSDDSEFF